MTARFGHIDRRIKAVQAGLHTGRVRLAPGVDGLPAIAEQMCSSLSDWLFAADQTADVYEDGPTAKRKRLIGRLPAADRRPELVHRFLLRDDVAVWSSGLCRWEATEDVPAIAENDHVRGNASQCVQV